VSAILSGHYRSLLYEQQGSHAGRLPKRLVEAHNTGTMPRKARAADAGAVAQSQKKGLSLVKPRATVRYVGLAFCLGNISKHFCYSQKPREYVKKHIF